MSNSLVHDLFHVWMVLLKLRLLLLTITQ